MKYALIVLFVTTLILFPSVSRAQYEITDNCVKAWEDIMDLKILSAKLTIQKEIEENPANYYAYYVDQACDAVALVINASDQKYKEFVKSYEARRDIMDNHDSDSPYYQACRAEMMLHMSIFNVLYGDKLTGVRNGYRALKITDKNLDAFPDFGLSKKLAGFFNSATSNLPPFVQWVVGVFGIDSDGEKGLNYMYDYFNEVKDIPGINAEASLFIILSYKLVIDPEKAFQFISNQNAEFSNYRLIKYFYANTAYRSGRNDLAYEIMLDFNLAGAEIAFLPYDYQMGRILLNKLDPEAITFFNNYLGQTKNENYQKEIYYKSALYYLINGDENKFMFYKLQAEEKGKEVNERDTETMYDCSFEHIPDINLTKAKLQIDGGYYQQALGWLEEFKRNEKDYIVFKLEYLLLSGRYELGIGNREKAMAYYKNIIELGEDEDYYFASEAAMRLGMIYLEIDTNKAEEYFELSRDLYDSDYYVYIDAVSKKELKKLEDK